MTATEILDELESLLAEEADAENKDRRAVAMAYIADAFVTAGPALLRLARAAIAVVDNSRPDIENGCVDMLTDHEFIHTLGREIDALAEVKL